MGEAISLAYVLVLAALTVLGLHRLHLVWLAWCSPREVEPPPPAAWPRVTVQLPLYDEATVAARLIDAVAALDYPRELLEVQVLDDSDDETRELVAERVAWHRGLGLSIEHVLRADRRGFKAGALAHGLERAEGELIAIFDADFVPAPDFLRRTIPHLCADRSLGLVQACWAHENREQGLLTRLQALALDAHFRVEQAARSRSGRFFNFNGTAGVWRRAAIEDAGGWAADTITEDLDLSLRSQLCGWRFRFVEAVEVPAELPRDLHALRAQQARWTRGSGQTARKLLAHVWRTPGVALAARVEATFQLLLNAAYPLLLLLALLSVPLVARGSALLELQWALFALATLSVTLFYVAGQRPRGARGALEALALTPALFACGLGLSLSNGLAFLRGLGGGPTAFERTPKQGARAGRYRARPHLACGAAELLLGLYALGGGAWGLAAGRTLALPFLTLVALGFLATALSTFAPARAARGSLPAPLPTGVAGGDA
ncbi:MAG: glycosyltransferase family 2 protein [Planctomycetota bacterium]